MNWDYIAGFFDGEGSITKVGKNSFRITFAQNNKDVLDAIKLFLNGYGIHSWITKKRPSKAYPNNIGYHLAFAKSEAVRLFLTQVIPYLIVKKDLAIITLPLLTVEPNKQPTELDYMKAKLLLKAGFTYRETNKTIGIKFSFTKLKELKDGLEVIP